MKKYNVVIHYAGAFNVQVEAESKDQAEMMAEYLFNEAPDADLIAGLAEMDICDCWEEE